MDEHEISGAIGFLTTGVALLLKELPIPIEIHIDQPIHPQVDKARHMLEQIPMEDALRGAAESAILYLQTAAFIATFIITDDVPTVAQPWITDAFKLQVSGCRVAVEIGAELLGILPDDYEEGPQ